MLEFQMLMGNSSQVDKLNTNLGQSYRFCILQTYQRDMVDQEQQFRVDSSSRDHMWSPLQYLNYHRHCHTKSQLRKCYNQLEFDQIEQCAMFQLDKQF